MIAKADSVGTDVVIFDLEDAVPPTEKLTARQMVGQRLDARNAPADAEGRQPQLFVRINRRSWDELEAELRSVVCPALAGICLPKVEAPAEVATVGELLSRLEQENSLAAGAVKLLLLIESARGLLHAEQIAGADSRVVAIAFGAEDFTFDMGIERSKEASGLDHARWWLAVSARAADALAIDCVYPYIDDEPGLIRETVRAKQLGYQGKLVVHPRQVEVVNQLFSPTSEEIEQARRLVETYEQARAQGIGAVLFEGRLVDAPVASRARRLLAGAEGQGR